MAAATRPTPKQVGMIKTLAFERFTQETQVDIPPTKELAHRLIEELLAVSPIEIHPNQTAQILALTAAVQELDSAFESPLMPSNRARANQLKRNLQTRLDRLTNEANESVDVLSTFVRPRSQNGGVSESQLEDVEVAF